jgi:hypothetical protein
MQRTLLPIVAGCVAAVFFAVPKPASATNAAAPAVHYGETNAGMVQEVGRRYWRGGRRYVAPYAYGYRPYYRPYGYYRPYAYGGYYGRPYGYYGRPGISLGFGF